MRPTVVYVDNAGALQRGLRRSSPSAERFAFDTEFVGERTYVPVLELIQVATPTQTALIDCRAVPSLEPFFAVLERRRASRRCCTPASRISSCSTA